MDREKERIRLPFIKDNALRQAETSKIELQKDLEGVVSHLFIARKGRIPEHEEKARVLYALQVLLYDSCANPSQEEKERIDYAIRILGAEMQK